ncbi:hypothetical protein DPMN_145734 [Dreissena polymorpha]|uniref:Uncharacterized protein n=1 Tax=Dreissena polymorpha TaxID=45954 RepID=A0A9D4J1H2_DREPO|nr:hypothetical protein DPMN_145734 [Dreissena polymorpha]
MGEYTRHKWVKSMQSTTSNDIAKLRQQERGSSQEKRLRLDRRSMKQGWDEGRFQELLRRSTSEHQIVQQLWTNTRERELCFVIIQCI